MPRPRNCDMVWLSGSEPPAQEAAKRGDEAVVLFDLRPVPALADPVEPCVREVVEEPQPGLEGYEAVLTPVDDEHLLRDSGDIFGGQRPWIGRIRVGKGGHV